MIVKGSRDIQYGHKLNLTNGKSGLVLERAGTFQILRRVCGGDAQPGAVCPANHLTRQDNVILPGLLSATVGRRLPEHGPEGSGAVKNTANNPVTVPTSINS